MNLLVMGAGAIGSVFGGLMAVAGHQVSLIGRAPHMEAIRNRGLLIKGIWGNHSVKNLNTFITPEELPRRDWDLIIIATKSYDVREAVSQAFPLLSQETLVMTVQNGLGNMESALEVIGRDRVLGARVIFGVEIVDAGIVTVTVYADKVVLGSPGQGLEYQRVEEIARAFDQAGIPAEATREIEKFVWGKVLYNCSLNALSALLEVNYGELLEHAETRQIMSDVIVEVFAVGHKQGVNLEWNSPSQYQELLFGRLIPDTYAHRGSMLQDILNGKRTEIDSMNGAVANFGGRLGVATPVNCLLTRLIKSKERIKRHYRLD